MIEKKSLSRFSFVLPLLPDPVLHSYAMHIFFRGGVREMGEGKAKSERNCPISIKAVYSLRLHLAS